MYRRKFYFSLNFIAGINRTNNNQNREGRFFHYSKRARKVPLRFSASKTPEMAPVNLKLAGSGHWTKNITN